MDGFAFGRGVALTWVRSAVRRGCGVCKQGEAWQLRPALRLRGGRFLSCLGKKGTKEAAFGLRYLRCGKCTCPYVRIQTELPTDGLAPYVQTVGVGGCQPEFGEAHPHRALRCCGAASSCVSRRTKCGGRRTHPLHLHSRVQWYNANVCGKPNKGRRGRRPLRRLLR
jgi:hypothetical protein